VSQIQTPDEKIGHTYDEKEGIIDIPARRPSDDENAERYYDDKYLLQSMEKEKIIKTGRKNQ